MYFVHIYCGQSLVKNSEWMTWHGIIHNYCLVIWMFHCRVLNNKINRRHERKLRVICNNKNSNFDDLFISTHLKNINALAIGIYKTVTGFSPGILTEIFYLQEKSYYYLNLLFHVVILSSKEANHLHFWDLRFGNSFEFLQQSNKYKFSYDWKRKNKHKK